MLAFLRTKLEESKNPLSLDALVGICLLIGDLGRTLSGLKRSPNVFELAHGNHGPDTPWSVKVGVVIVILQFDLI